MFFLPALTVVPPIRTSWFLNSPLQIPFGLLLGGYTMFHFDSRTWTQCTHYPSSGKYHFQHTKFPTKTACPLYTACESRQSLCFPWRKIFESCIRLGCEQRIPELSNFCLVQQFSAKQFMPMNWWTTTLLEKTCETICYNSINPSYVHKNLTNLHSIPAFPASCGTKCCYILY